ncbi:hypothetical protein [uncultured Sphingobium sp.]|mgnify:CR=1 FL=1|uniref:phage tail terminator protein n=1 Tax=uncultured Sphingobium sp. TaxID=316087 RepID=UPI00259B4089|nr:hypothetical protein [uncultured Sphingobium sp.]
MIAQGPIVNQLMGYAGFRSVKGVLEWAGLTESPRAVPALFVVPQGDTGQPNRMSGVIDQKVDETFGVVVIVEGRPRAGDEVDDGLKREVDRVIDAMVGWTHPEAGRPTEYGGGRLLSADGYRVAWMLTFKTSSHIRKQSQ